MNNPYYHELAFTGIDPVFIRWAIGAIVTAILMTVINTAEKPISWRCRGIKPEGKRVRACRRIATVRLANVKKERKAIVLPSSSWDKELAMIVTGITLWQGVSCHGKGLHQFFINSETFYPFAEFNWLATVTIATVICYVAVKKLLFAASLLKVAVIVKWYAYNGVDIPPVAEKWGLFDVTRRIAVKNAERAKRYQLQTQTKKESGERAS